MKKFIIGKLKKKKKKGKGKGKEEVSSSVSQSEQQLPRQQSNRSPFSPLRKKKKAKNLEKHNCSASKPAIEESMKTSSKASKEIAVEDAQCNLSSNGNGNGSTNRNPLERHNKGSNSTIITSNSHSNISNPQRSSQSTQRTSSNRTMHRGESTDTVNTPSRENPLDVDNGNSKTNNNTNNLNHSNSHNHNHSHTNNSHTDDQQQSGTGAPVSKQKAPHIRRRNSGTGGGRKKPHKNASSKDGPDDQSVSRMYDSVPPLEVTQLPRGGISIETEAVGRIQFGIPPETIKDSMQMGLDVPLYYIVPIERFCREMGPALGVNLAEFEFPAYFNFFVQKQQCTLIVDSEDAERNIRRVFSETLLGPAHFRKRENAIRYDPEDFASDFNQEAIPDFEKELKHFRVGPTGDELVLETLLNFCHFEQPFETRTHENLGVPPPEPIDANANSVVGKEMGGEKKHKPSAYSRMKLCSEVSVVYPKDATKQEKANRTCKRVEIFKIQAGEEYIMHDINENNIIVGKTRFSGNVRVSESMSVHGFGTQDDYEEDDDDDDEEKTMIPKSVQPPTFHPPSFGVTVLGNSHGFDKSGSVSGYVLWINGRGVMIDPPPYSSATLEREGIRPRTIVGIILTHCHADHDAGAFQKVLTGSPVVVITTPTIYKSFIRKYAALSNLSPALLRHSHRHKPAIIGTPLRFQGATFQFTYTLHSIPCVGFRVEWRGRSMVFTGDHFNSPPDIDKLQEKGVLAKARADDLRNLPLQEADLLLHEAGVPPLHTPLDVLLKLPQRVKDRLYVVHTQALPPDCELRVAPTGTAGTIRLDVENPITNKMTRRNTINSSLPISEKVAYEDELGFQSMWTSSEYDSYIDVNVVKTPQTRAAPRSSINSLMSRGQSPPPVALRPTSSTDAWFTLNLLSAVPFLSGLSYASTMEVLETAKVDAFCINEVVVEASRRSEVLCVVWEGTCMERPVTSRNSLVLNTFDDLTASITYNSTAVWHAGDWTGPISLQPEKQLSGESQLSRTHDVVAMSKQGVKVITIEFASLHKILESGSLLYRTHLQRKKEKEMAVTDEIPECLQGVANNVIFLDAVRNLEILELLEYNTALRKLSAVQKRHLESLAEGPVFYPPGQRLWRSGTAVENAFIVIGGTVSFVAKRRNAGSVGAGFTSRDNSNFADSPKREVDDFSSLGASIGEMMRQNAAIVRQELEGSTKEEDDGLDLDQDLSLEEDSSLSSSSDVSLEKAEGKIDLCAHLSSQDSVRSESSSVDAFNLDYERLSLGLQKRADNFGTGSFMRDSASTDASASAPSKSEYSNEDVEDTYDSDVRVMKIRERRRSSRDRNANRQLNRLYNRRAFTAGLVFSKGHFLGDISKMVAGLLSSTYQGKDNSLNGDDNSAKYGFGEKNEGKSNSRGGLIGEMTIHEQEGDQHIVHSSTLAAGKDGCVVLVFPKPSLILFLDEYPGLLLSLLGTQVVL